jgi:hypothetical protein
VELFLTSWTISEQPIKEILKHLDSGMITNINCLLDSRVKINCPNAYQIAQHRLANLKLCHIHAKLAVLKGTDLSVTINSSANLSRNQTIEAYVLTESKELADYHSEWILEKLKDSNPFER